MDREPNRQSTLAAAPWGDAAQAMYRAAQAVSHPGGPSLMGDLVRELAETLQAAAVFIAVHDDDSRRTMRTLAVRLDGQPLRNFDYALAGTPCAQVVGHAFRYVSQGVASEFPSGSLFAAKGMDAYAAYPLNDHDGTALGLLVAMDRQPIASAELAEALLKIFAARIVAEIERGRSDEAFRAAALAVSSARGESVFAELVRYLATILHCEVAFVARCHPLEPQRMSMLALSQDGEIQRDYDYELDGTPCRMVLGQSFRAYPERLREHFPDAADARALGLESYAGYPLQAPDGTPLGVISVASRRPLLQVERIESMLKIFAVRVAAEIERLDAAEAMQRAAASYRAIFEAAEDAIFIHDWDSGAVLDVNPKACETYGYSREELIDASVDQISSGVEPYTGAQALRHIQQARLGRCPPFEWQRRNKDGSLHWDEVRLKPVMIEGRRHVLAFTRDITERKAALAALQAQEQKYRAIFDGTVDSMVLWDSALRVVDINHAFVQLTGLTREQIIGRHWSERPDADDLPQLLGLVEDALQGRIGQATLNVSRADGSRFEIELRYLPVHFGAERYALGVGRDVSERLERERQLRDSEAQYRAIFNASADALVLRDAEFRIVDVNATYERMSGWGREEVLGLDRIIANPAEVALSIRAQHARALAGEPVLLEVPLLRRDGERYELELRGVPILHRGQPHVLYIGRDMTANKRAEAALRDSEEQYRAIFNAAADGLVLRDQDYRAVDVNPAYLAMSGYTREEVLHARRALTQLDPAIQQRHWEQHGRILRGEHVRFEVLGTRKDGLQFEVEVSAMPLMYRGEPHVLYAARDISERREAEERRSELELQLRQAQKMEAIGQLTGGIAHDFNNILTSVVGYLVLGQERAETLGDAKLQRQLGQAHLAAQRARELIAQMLAFARRQRGERRVLSLAPLVGQTLQLLRATLPSSLTVEFQGAEFEHEAQVAADAVQLEQVLFNLCINARDAIQGPGSIRVRLARQVGSWRCASCRARGDGGSWVALSVADSGCGIAPELLERIFEPFISTKDVGRGSGMGLAMVHGIVHDHGGHVMLDTAPGRGSVFSVLLPPAQAEGVAAVDAPAATDTATAPALCGRVMVVDDEAMVGEFMAERLDSWGLDVVLHNDPLQALRWLEDANNRLDLLITDQTMPLLTGLELAQRTAALRPGLPVLLYSGHTEGLDPAELRRHGVCALLRKPVDAEALRAMLQRCLETSRQRPAG
jgi:PAS domain S-box-containing protein